jgi:hypothetical protein
LNHRKKLEPQKKLRPQKKIEDYIEGTEEERRLEPYRKT